MKFKLDENQQRAKDFHLSRQWSFNCMNMGEGKTLTALETVRQARCKSLLVYCPAYLIQNWKDEINKFYGDSYIPVEFLSYASKKKPKPHDAVIEDEFHYLKSYKAQRSDRVFQYLRKHKPKIMIGLSGTPMKNSAWDFYTYFCMLSLKHKIQFPRDPYAFQATFCRKVENDFTPSGFSYEGVSEENKEELKHLISPHFYFTPMDLSPDLPEAIDKKYVAHAPKNKVVLMEKALEDGRSQEFMSLKAVNAEYNCKTTIKLMEDLIYEGKRPVVFTEHRASAKIIAQKFQTTPIIGGVSSAVRNALLKKFDNTDSTVLVGTYGAMGVGLNITSSDTMIFNDYCFSPSDYDQARKRIHRKGQENTCFYHHVFSNELDYQIFNRVIRKKKESDEIHRR